MTRRSTLRPIVLVVAVLAAPLGVGTLSPVGAVEGAAPTVTTLAAGPSDLHVGDSVTLTAHVTSGGAPVLVGEVIFNAAPSEDLQWDLDASVGLGIAAVDADGDAELTVPLTTQTVPFLATGEPFSVAADYEPFEKDGPGMYDTLFQASLSDPVALTATVRPVATTTTTVTGPTQAPARSTATLRATVEPASATGTVQFSVGGKQLSAVPVVGGVATRDYPVGKQGTTAAITATFTPTDPTAYAPSSDPTGVTLTAGPQVPAFYLMAGRGAASDGGTVRVEAGSVGMGLSAILPDAATMNAPTVTVTGQPDRPWAPSGTNSWIATVPLAAGTYTVSVDYASTVGTVASGHASFTVVAVTPPVATTTALTATALTVGGQKRVRLSATVTAADGSVPQGVVQFGAAWLNDRGAPVRLVGGRASADFGYDALAFGALGTTYHGGYARFSPDDSGRYSTTLGDGVDVDDLTWVTADQTTTGQAVGSGTATVSGTNCAGGATAVAVATGGAGAGGVSATVTTTQTDSAQSCGKTRVAARAAARAASTRMACTASASGYRCPLGTLAPGTAFSFSLSYPLPASAAGRTVTVTATATSTSPVTGAVTTLVTSRKTVQVPRRTVLSATLAPATKSRSVRRSRAIVYRVVVRNAGVVTATKVWACVTLGPGAKVRAAEGAKVRGRSACWTVPALRRGRAVTRSLTLVAPRRRGGLPVVLAVTPAKSQASPLRLRAALPVR